MDLWRLALAEALGLLPSTDEKDDAEGTIGDNARWRAEAAVDEGRAAEDIASARLAVATARQRQRHLGWAHDPRRNAAAALGIGALAVGAAALTGAIIVFAFVIAVMAPLLVGVTWNLKRWRTNAIAAERLNLDLLERAGASLAHEASELPEPLPLPEPPPARDLNIALARVALGIPVAAVGAYFGPPLLGWDRPLLKTALLVVLGIGGLAWTTYRAHERLRRRLPDRAPETQTRSADPPAT